ncbi:MAG: phosphotransferase family protein [Rhodospirillales bacterium]
MTTQWGGSPRFLDRGVETVQAWDRLAAHLTDAGFHFDPIGDPPNQFAAGFGNLNYLVKVDGCDMVLRRPPMGNIPPGANDMKREHRILNVLWQAFPLAPRSFHYCEDHDVLGNHFLLMDYRPGATIGGQLPVELCGNPRIGESLTDMLVDVLVALHHVEPAAVGLGEFGRPEGFLARAVAGWRKRLMIGAGDAPSVVALEVVDWLEANQVPDGAPVLLHNDFKLDNILLEPATLEPVALIDWDMGSRGDPLFDLGTLLSYWVEPDDPPAMQVIEQMPTAMAGFPDRRDVIEMYAQRSGRDVSNFRFYRVLTQFKLAVVFLQIYAQYRRGTTIDERFGRFGPHIDGLFEFARDIAHGRID